MIFAIVNMTNPKAVNQGHVAAGKISGLTLI